MTETPLDRTSPGRRRGRLWTRRAALGTLSALGAAALLPALPRPALAAGPQDGLHAFCLDTTKSAAARRLGEIRAASREVAEVEAGLRARVSGGATRAEWTAALLEGGRQDLARNDTVDVDGHNLTWTEAEVLALGARLRASAAVA